MSQLEVPRECAQVLCKLSPTNEEEEEEEEEGRLLTSESILTISGSLLPCETEVKKPLIEVCVDELQDLKLLEDLGATYFL
jgi:hypothetical protein